MSYEKEEAKDTDKNSVLGVKLADDWLPKHHIILIIMKKEA